MHTQRHGVAKRRISETNSDAEHDLEELVALQVARIGELEALVLELRARLDQNSRNSSKPPSSDGYAKPEAKKDGKDRSLRRRSGRKPGGQAGHEGHRLERREDPDRRCCIRLRCAIAVGGI
ncbi:MAG: DUF6444 domain-containing protein [Solirubrobacteraceae bacterium]